MAQKGELLFVKIAKMRVGERRNELNKNKFLFNLREGALFDKELF